MSLVISLMALLIAFVALWFSNQITKSAEKSIFRMTAKELSRLNATLEKQRRDMEKAQAQIKTLKNILSKLDDKIASDRLPSARSDAALVDRAPNPPANQAMAERII